MSTNDKPSFLDRSTIMAIIVVMGFWLAWSKYMESKYPAKDPAQAAAESASPASPTDGKSVPVGQAVQAVQAGAEPSAVAGASAPASESFIDFSDDHWSFQVSSFGMGLKDIDIKGYKTRENEPIVLGHVAGNYPFATSLIGNDLPVVFTIEKKDATTLVGTAVVGALHIEKTMRIDSANNTLQTEVKVTGAANGFKGLKTVLSDNTQEAASGGFLSRSYDRQDWYLSHGGEKTRAIINKSKGVPPTSATNVEVAALSSHYFALAVVDHSDLQPSFETKMDVNATIATGRLSYNVINANDTFDIKYVAFAGPKSYDTLKSIDPKLVNIVDYGMFAVIARPLLKLMQELFLVFGNWGVAIIVMTIIVRLVVLPFNIFSYKSMKAMQRIQPEMNRIKERYKDKPSDQKLQMNQEIMELMKRNKANPLGGCLPMLLQLPVFFALYQVLGQSIDLYRQPFMFWIQDLSSKDPYYVLPVLMGITMFTQQKITPTTMDPQQAKIMVWMPVLFSFFMISLPSGLTLYIFVSTLFAIIQQFLLMRDRTPAATVKEAKA